MRWRVEREVFSGKGQFECGNKHCSSREQLSSWEVNFTYVEHGQRKNALVKLRLCLKCSTKLNYTSKKRLIKREIKEKAVDKHRVVKRRNSQTEGRSPSSSTNLRLNFGNSLDVRDEGENIQIKIENSLKDKETGSDSKAKINDGHELWSGKSMALIDAEKTANAELDEFIDDLLL